MTLNVGMPLEFITQDVKLTKELLIKILNNHF